MMKTFSSIAAAVVLASLAAIGSLHFGLVGNRGASAAAETTLERITRTGTIRCGYSQWFPLMFIDMKTGEKKGIFHDVMEEIGARLSLNVVWQEELGWGTIVESVKTGRVDMACSGYWLHPDRIKHVSSSFPQIFTPLYVWVRQDEGRVFNDPDELNTPDLMVSNIDGGATTQLLFKRFPKTRVYSLPEMASNGDEIQALLSGKVDFLIEDATTMSTYEANNPGKVRSLFPGRPLVVFPTAMLLPPDDPRLREVIDNALRNIEYDGTFDAILKKYGMENAFLRNPAPVARP